MRQLETAALEIMRIAILQEIARSDERICPFVGITFPDFWVD
ncbi:hypothetical protein [Rhodoferax sp.]